MCICVSIYIYIRILKLFNVYAMLMTSYRYMKFYSKIDLFSVSLTKFTSMLLIAVECMKLPRDVGVMIGCTRSQLDFRTSVNNY